MIVFTALRLTQAATLAILFNAPIATRTTSSTLSTPVLRPVLVHST